MNFFLRLMGVICLIIGTADATCWWFWTRLREGPGMGLFILFIGLILYLTGEGTE